MPPNIAAICLILLTGFHWALTVVLEPNASRLEITTGAYFNLNCTGDTELQWEYPNSTSSHTTVTKYNSPDGMFVTDLQIKGAHYMDTGFYKCSSKNSDASQLYLYVRDAHHLLVVNSNDNVVIRHSQHHPLIIPCRPTSPDVIVTIQKESENIELQYNNTIGFLISDPVMDDSGSYTCLANRHYQNEEVQYLINVVPRSEAVSKPIISVEGYEGKHVIVGEDITIKCKVTVDVGVHTSLAWELPSHVNPEKITPGSTETYKIEERTIEKRQSSSNLKISNVSLQDSGKYTCLVSDHSDNRNNDSYQLIVYPVDMKFLNLTMEGKSEIHVRETEREAQWIVNIKAYPTPSIKWYGPDNKPLDRNEKYTIVVDSDKTKITIRNITIEDSGIYTLYASNSVKNETLNVTLLVEAKPRVHLQKFHKNYFFLNEEIVIDCNITAYPLPVINWTFYKCRDHKIPCENRNKAISEVPNTLRNVSYVKWHSQIKLHARNSGIIECKAQNTLGAGEAQIQFKVTDVRDGFGIWGPSQTVLSSDNIVIGCGASIYEYESKISWFYANLDGSKTEEMFNSSRRGVSIITNRTSFSYQTFLYLSSVSVDNSGSFSCQVKSFIDSRYREKKFELLVQGRKAPIFTNFTNINGSDKTLPLGRPINLTCGVIAIPKPKIIWYKDNKIFAPKSNRVYFKDNNQTLQIMYSTVEDSGKYNCTASNGLEPISASTKLRIVLPPRSASIWQWATYLTALLFILVLILVIALIWSFRKTRHEKEKRKAVGLYYFASGQVESIDPNVEIGEQADLLPYHDRWEFPKHKLKLGKQLGSGAFGVVLKGEAMGIAEENVQTTVAVKMVKLSSDITHVRALAAELKIMAHLGQHLNVVNLLGACTRHIHRNDLLVIVEHCKYGNLHKYLMHHRNSFINQLDPATGTVDFSNMKEPTELTYINANTYTTSNGTSEGTNGLSVRTDMTTLSTPVGDDGYLLNVDYQGDYKMNSVRPISTQDLFCWGYQVAKGMEYLVSRKVLHGDLAARNILLAEGNIVKICDFGLSKNLYYKDNYKNSKRDVLLPFKWMSIEAIRDGIYSTQSDIWAFGIFLWEMFSLAITPYPGLYGEQVYDKLLQGYRMDKPKFATEDAYNLMQECWKEQPMLRPTFTECSERLGGLLGDAVKQHYLELNSSYMQKNTVLTSENDHLGKLKDPSYENCLRSSMPDGLEIGYICMKPSKTDAVNETELKPMITPGSSSFLNPGYQDVKKMSNINYINVPQVSTGLEVEPDIESDKEAEAENDPKPEKKCDPEPETELDRDLPEHYEFVH